MLDIQPNNLIPETMFYNNIYRFNILKYEPVKSTGVCGILSTEFRDCFFLFAREKRITSIEQLTTIMRSLGFSPTVNEITRYYTSSEKGVCMFSSGESHLYKLYKMSLQT